MSYLTNFFALQSPLAAVLSAKRGRPGFYWRYDGD
jgi:hypothetical protein